jgi:predicted AAA+ superfamily ATPase
MNKRYLHDIIKEDALKARKTAFISGPRQVGKTTLAKSILTNRENYFSWDQVRFRRQWIKNPEFLAAEISKGTLVLDEIHKDRRWKQRLKGLYDTADEDLKIIVTGSARLDIYRKGGDSLLGRYIPYRLHPFSVAENSTPAVPFQCFQDKSPCYPLEALLQYGGFPEPLFGANSEKALRWSRLRLERLVQEDVRDLRHIQDLSALTVLCDFLPLKVGSLLSINNLRQDVGVAYATVRDWIQVLNALYICFLIKPYSKKLNRMVSAKPKLYLFDILQIENTAKRLENLTALHLLKACNYWTDTAQGNFELHFVRSKDSKEVDFLITNKTKPWMLIECKSNSKALNPTLLRFKEQLGTQHNFQLVSTPNYFRKYKEENVIVCAYEKFFSQLV